MRMLQAIKNKICVEIIKETQTFIVMKIGGYGSIMYP